MKIVFLGTPEFGADILKTLVESKHTVVGVVCQPDRLGNRRKIEVCDVKKYALEQNLPVFQFEKISKEGVDILKNLNADVFVTAAYGQILSNEILDIPKYGVYNVHGSLLPKYRGAAPVQFALLNGDKVTGVTIMKTVYEMDSGDIAEQREVEIQQNDNAYTILKKLALVGGEALLKFLDDLQEGNIILIPQNNKQATFCNKISNEISQIDWNKSNVDIFNLIRALNPNPIAFTLLNGINLKIFESLPVDLDSNAQNGEVVECSKQALTIKCGDGGLKILSLQLAGCKKLSYKDFINGRKIQKGDILGK